MNLLETLIHPDKEDQDDRAEVNKAANLLQVGEFQLLQLAFYDWHKRDMPNAVIDRLFANYMLHNEVPFWARRYARTILEAEARGELDCDDAHYHRYDADYHTFVPNGRLRFLSAVAVVVLCVGGGLLIAEFAAKPGASILPPYFERGSLKQGTQH
jgi:hypothetical protein